MLEFRSSSCMASTEFLGLFLLFFRTGGKNMERTTFYRWAESVGLQPKWRGFESPNIENYRFQPKVVEKLSWTWTLVFDQQKLWRWMNFLILTINPIVTLNSRTREKSNFLFHWTFSLFSTQQKCVGNNGKKTSRLSVSFCTKKHQKPFASLRERVDWRCYSSSKKVPKQKTRVLVSM